MEYVGRRIRDFRTSYGGGPGISQDALAKALGVSTNTVSRWETAVYRPTIEDLDKLARFFGKSILEFFPKGMHSIPENGITNSSTFPRTRIQSNLS